MSVFLRGIITDDRLPLVSEFFVCGDAEATPVRAILDTGFTGMVVLPSALRARGQFAPAGYATYELADGALVTEELFSGCIRLGRRTIDVVVSFTESHLGLIGMALIEGKRVSLNLKDRIFRVYD